jgi:hypothetical protein
MIVRGELEGHAVRVATDWSNTAPLDTLVELTPRAPIAARHHGIRVDESRALADADGEPRSTPVDSEIEGCLERVLKESWYLLVTAEELTLVLSGPVFDATPVMPLLLELASLAELMSVRRGAYR